MVNFIDNNDVYQFYNEGKLCLACNHAAHCGVTCTAECNCFECDCFICRQPKQKIGPTDV